MIANESGHHAGALPQPSPVTDDEVSGFTMPVSVAIASDDSLAGGRQAAERARTPLPNGIVETWPDTPTPCRGKPRGRWRPGSMSSGPPTSRHPEPRRINHHGPGAT